jgi:hypothetical protein
MLQRKSKAGDKPVKTKTKAAPKPKKEKVKASAPKVSAKSDVFTVMLGLALLAVLLSCIFLALELNKYQFDLKAQKADARTVSASFFG